MGSWVPATLASLARVNKRELDDHGGSGRGEREPSPEVEGREHTAA